MKVIPFIGEKTIEVVPRYFPLPEDSLNIVLRSEINNIDHTPIFDYTTSTNTMEITFEENATIFIKNMKYVITITDGEDLVYIGKAICLENTDQEDIQNFKKAVITGTKIKI